LRGKISALGYELDETEFKTVHERFVALADKKKQVYDEDVDIIVQDVIFAQFTDSALYGLESYKISTGNGSTPKAKVRLRKGDVILEASSEGDGPIDAIFKAIDKIAGIDHKLEQFQVNAVTETKEAMGVATVWVSREGFRALGRGSSTDILKASAKAYVEAINRIFCFLEHESERHLYIDESADQKEGHGPPIS